MEELKPMVSIIVITYNSAKYVLETLESAKTQTYQNIELIISDDDSTDNTIQICKDWLAQNKSRFVRTELITVEKNTGIPANCNRGIKAAQGKWVKFIAGDDILSTDCISSNINYLIISPGIDVLFSKMQFFSIRDGVFIPGKVSPTMNEFQWFFNESISAKGQHRKLLVTYFIPTPTSFIRRVIFERVGFFDERFSLIEDYPFWLKLTQNNIKLFIMDKLTIYYRVHSESVFNGDLSKGALVKEEYLRNEIWREEYLYPFYSQFGKLRHRYHYKICHLFSERRNNKFNRFFLLVIQKYANPFFLCHYIFYKYFKKNLDLKNLLTESDA